MKAQKNKIKYLNTKQIRFGIIKYTCKLSFISTYTNNSENILGKLLHTHKSSINKLNQRVCRTLCANQGFSVLVQLTFRTG